MLTMVHSNKAYGRAGSRHIWPLANEGNTRELKTSVPNSGAVSPVWTAGEGRYGPGAYSFNGANRILSYSISGTSSLSNFTIAFWTKLDDAETAFNFTSQNTNTLTYYAIVYKHHARLRIHPTDSPTIDISAVELVANKWTYIMWQRSGTSCKFYVDGVEKGSTTSSVTFPNWGSKKFHIGNQGDLGNEAIGYIRGYAQDFIITSQILPTTPPVRPLR